MRLADLPTPCLVLDRGGFDRTLARAAEAARHRGVALRPSMAALKSIDAARHVFQALHTQAAPAIAVSTLAEAEYFASHDVADILYAVAITPERLAQLGKLGAADAVFTVITADPESAAAINAQAGATDGGGTGGGAIGGGAIGGGAIGGGAIGGGARRTRLRALIEVECGGGTGIAVDHPAFAATATRLGACLEGVTAVASPGAMDHAVERLRAAAAALRAGGHACRAVLLRGSDTLSHDGPLGGVTDVVAATALLVAAGHDGASVEASPLTVLASVLARQSEPDGGGRALVDAGATALSAACEPAGGGFGRLLDVRGRPRFGLAVLRGLWQERALVAFSGALRGLPALGERVRVVPVRPSLAACAHDRFFVVDGDDEVVAVWPRVIGW